MPCNPASRILTRQLTDLHGCRVARASLTPRAPPGVGVGGDRPASAYFSVPAVCRRGAAA